MELQHWSLAVHVEVFVRQQWPLVHGMVMLPEAQQVWPVVHTNPSPTHDPSAAAELGMAAETMSGPMIAAPPTPAILRRACLRDTPALTSTPDVSRRRFSISSA